MYRAIRLTFVGTNCIIYYSAGTTILMNSVDNEFGAIEMIVRQTDVVVGLIRGETSCVRE